MELAYEAPIGNTRMAIAEGDYIFAIAPMLKIPEYAEAVKRTRELTRPMPLYIDNGVYEDQLMGVEEYVELCLEWKPDVVVAPDVLFGMEKTAELATEFFRRLGKEPPFDVMFVPQGNDFVEREKCAWLVKGEWDYQILGLGLGAFNKDWHSRIAFYEKHKDEDLCVHILGIANIADLCYWKGIAGTVDTSLPFHLAQEGKDLLRKKETKRLDWADTLVGRRLALAESNISMLEGMLENV